MAEPGTLPGCPFFLPNELESICAFLKVLYKFRIQKPCMVDYQGAFGDYLSEPASADLVGAVHTRRVFMAQELCNPAATPESKIAATQDFIRYAFQLDRNVANSQTVFTFPVTFRFSWTSSLIANELEVYTSTRISHDYCMSVAALANLHAWIGADMAMINNGDLSAAGGHLRTAAGLYDYLSGVYLPSWHSDSNEKSTRPSEGIEPMTSLMSAIFTCQAQQLAIIKAIQGGRTPSSLLAKLCFGCSRIIFSSRTMLSTTAPIQFTRMQGDLHLYLSFMQEIMTALGCMFWSEALFAKQEPGQAMSIIDHKTLKHLAIRKDPSLPGLLELKNNYASLKVHYDVLLTRLSRIRTEMKRDNDLIYFQPLTNEEDLPSPPEFVIMMKPVEYLAEGVTAINLRKIIIESSKATPTSSIFNRLTSFFSSDDDSKSAAQSPVVMMSSVPKSDEEMAREIQAKYDSGQLK